MQVVWLSGNPLSTEPSYRGKVIRQLQQIKKLDNIGKLLDKFQPKLRRREDQHLYIHSTEKCLTEEIGIPIYMYIYSLIKYSCVLCTLIHTNVHVLVTISQLQDGPHTIYQYSMGAHPVTITYMSRHWDGFS